MPIELKDYSFIVLFATSLLCSLIVFTVIFFDKVQASNTNTIIKRYISNAAIIDSSVAETIAGAEKMCNSNQSGSKGLMTNSTVSFLTYASAIAVTSCFVLHLKYRLRNNVPLFSLKEQTCMCMLVIPLVVEVLVYFFSYVNFKYYSNIYIVKLLKNMRIRADLQYLSDLWSRDQSKIESSGSNRNGVCTSNCLPTEERLAMVQNLRSYLDTYNSMLDVYEWNNTSPSNIFTKISNLPSKTGTIFLLVFLAIECWYLWGMRIDNQLFTAMSLGIITVYTVYLFIIKDYLAATNPDNVATMFGTIFCNPSQDVVSTLLKTDLTDQSNYANDNV